MAIQDQYQGAQETKSLGAVLKKHEEQGNAPRQMVTQPQDQVQQYAPPDGYMAPSDYTQIPNYEKLTRMERWVMRSLPGLADSGVGRALASFNESWAGKALQFLDVGAEAVERATGFASQWIYSTSEADGGESFRNNLREAWYAGSLVADMGNTPRMENGQLVWPDDLPGIDGVIAARKQLIEASRQGVDLGDALIGVRDQYYSDIGALALRAQMRDAIFHIAGDPLNIIAGFIKPVEAVEKWKQVLSIDRYLPDEYATAIAKIADDIVDAEKLGDAVRVAELEAGLDTLQSMKQLGPWEQRFLRVFGGLGDDVIELPGPLKLLQKPFQLTNESRAVEYVNRILDNITAHIIGGTGDPTEWVRAIERVADGAFDPKLVHIMVSPSGRAVQGELKLFAAHARSMLNAYEMTTNERDLLSVVARVLKNTEYGVIKELADGEEAALLARFMESVGGDDAARLQEILARMGINELAADDLASLHKLFDGNEIYTPELFKLTMMNNLADNVAKTSVVLAGVRARGLGQAIAEAVKSAETLAFLRMNPAYPIKNWINNNITMIARGSYGTFTLDFAEGLWKRLGFEPPRLRTGYGPGEIIAEVAEGAERATTAAYQSATGIIRKAATGDHGFIDDITNFFKGAKAPFKDFGELAAQIEARSSMRAHTAGYLRGWNMFWKPENIADFSVDLATELGDDVARSIQNAVRSAMTDAELDAAVLSDNINLSMENILEVAGQKFGGEIKDVLTPEFTASIQDGLVEAAKRGPSALRDEMARIGDQVQKHIDDVVDAGIQNLIEETARQIETEGPGGYVKLWGDMVDEWYGTHERHAMDISKLAEQARSATGANADLMWDNILKRQDRFFGRAWNRLEARIRGLEAGAQAGGYDVSAITKNFGDWRSGWQGFFKKRNKLYQDFFDGSPKYTWDELTEVIDGDYIRMSRLEDQFLRQIDDVTLSFLPEHQRPLFQVWRDNVRAYRQADRNLVVKFRREIRGLPEAEVNELYKSHWQQRMQNWAQTAQEERMGVAALSGDPALQGRYAEDVERFLMGRYAEDEVRSVYESMTNVPGEEVIPAARFDGWLETIRDPGRYSLGDMRAFGTKEEWAIATSDPHIISAIEEVAASRGVTAQEIIRHLLEKPSEMPTAPSASLPDFYGIVPREAYMGTGIDQHWFTRGDDALRAIGDAAEEIVARKPIKIADLSETAQRQLMQYISKAKTNMSGARYKSIRFGEFMRDSALLNYNRRYNYNTALGMLAPYEFWATQSMYRWALHSIDRPAMLSSYLRIKKFLETAYRPEPGLPSRLKGTIRIQMPFLPKWMGNDIFVDPLRTMLPFDNFAYPFEQYQQQQAGDQGAAERVLEELLNDGRITQEEYQFASTNRSGPAWERAVGLARLDDTEGRLNGFDFMTMMTQPHAPIMWAYNAAKGTPENIGPFMPITRSIKGITALFGVSPSTGGVNPEGAIRRALGLPAFDKWDDYRIDRMLANMTASGEITTEEAKRAMIDRTGPAFAEAQRRAGIEFGVGALGSTIGIPMRAYPEGEEMLRELQDDYQYAWSRYEQGDAQAITNFYEENPEYETRLALFKSPEERLQTFLVDELWDTWNNLPSLHRSQVSEQLGEEFQQAFLDRNTRDYDAISPEKLGVWLRLLGGETPGVLDVQNAIPLNLAPRDVAYRAETFYRNREQSYPGIFEIQSDYFMMQEGAPRSTFLRDHPELKAYWDWRRDWLYRNPDVAPYLTDEPPKYESEQALQEAMQPSFTPEEWRSVMGDEAWRLTQDDEPLPDVVIDRLQELADNMGMSLQDILQQVR